MQILFDSVMRHILPHHPDLHTLTFHWGPGTEDKGHIEVIVCCSTMYSNYSIHVSKEGWAGIQGSRSRITLSITNNFIIKQTHFGLWHLLETLDP